MDATKTVLQNDTLAVAIDLHGAELKSLVHKATGNEYLWHGDPAYWGRSAPILFPIVGMLRDNRYTVDGVSYNLPQHGFARDSTFTRISCRETSATFLLEESQGTLKRYPYRFRLEACYTVENDQLEVEYTVTNTDNKPILFSIGSHPAFKIPFGKGLLDDYYIEFGNEESARARLPENGLQSDQWVNPFEKRRLIRLHKTLFNRGAFIFKDLASRSISIKSARTDQQICVGTGGAPYLGIWSKPNGAPFVCIEPWFGVADSIGSDGNFSRKEGIITLPIGSVWKGAYSIQIRAREP